MTRDQSFTVRAIAQRRGCRDPDIRGRLAEEDGTSGIRTGDAGRNPVLRPDRAYNRGGTVAHLSFVMGLKWGLPSELEKIDK